MTLEELIATLTTAQEQTDGPEEWTHGDFEIHAGMWLRAKFQFRGEAEASVLQHNTAGQVLEALKRLDEAESKARVCREDADINAERAEKAEAQLDRATKPWLDDEVFGDPLENAQERIKELLSMFDCQTCYDQGWVVGIEGADPGGGDPGNECQVACPDCLPKDRATKPRLDVLGCSLIRRAKSLGYSPTDGFDELETGYEALDWFEERLKPRPMSEAPREQGTHILMVRRARRVGGHWSQWPEPTGWLPLTEDPTS